MAMSSGRKRLALWPATRKRNMDSFVDFEKAMELYREKAVRNQTGSMIDFELK